MIKNKKGPYKPHDDGKEEQIKNVLEYHTALCGLENDLSSLTTGNKSQSSKEQPDIIERIGKTIKENIKSLSFSDNNDKEIYTKKITQLFSQKISQASEEEKRKLSPEEALNIMLHCTRAERKRFDRQYFQSLLNGEGEGLTELENFINNIKENDPTYYNRAVATVFKCFRFLKDEDRDRDQVKEDINSIIEDFSIEKTSAASKSWSERYFDRLLFDGALSMVTESTDGDTTPITPEKAAKISDNETAQEGINHLLERYKDPRTPGYKNAQNILFYLNYEMKQNGMENKPFPLLINQLYFSVSPDPKNQQPVFFMKKQKDFNGKPKLDEDGNIKYETNDRWNTYYGRKGLPRISMETSFKYLFKRKIEGNPNYKKLICDEIKQYLKDFCTFNALNSDVVKGVFDYYKEVCNKDSSTPEEAERKYYNTMYRYLFKTPYKEKGKKEIIDHGPLFHTEVHHDRERIFYSEDPNKEENFILTVNTNKDLGFKAIYAKLLNTLKNISLNDEKATNIDIEREEAIFDAIKHTFRPFNFHKDALHGADRRILDSSTSQYSFYFATPKIETDRPYAVINTDYYISLPEEKGPAPKKPTIPYDRGRD